MKAKREIEILSISDDQNAASSTWGCATKEGLVHGGRPKGWWRNSCQKGSKKQALQRTVGTDEATLPMIKESDRVFTKSPSNGSGMRDANDPTSFPRFYRNSLIAHRRLNACIDSVIDQLGTVRGMAERQAAIGVSVKIC